LHLQVKYLEMVDVKEVRLVKKSEPVYIGAFGRKRIPIYKGDKIVNGKLVRSNGEIVEYIDLYEVQVVKRKEVKSDA